MENTYNNYHIVKYILNVTRFKVGAEHQHMMHTQVSQQIRSDKQDLLKKVLTRQFLQQIEKQYPVTFTMTLYPQFSKEDILKIVEKNKNSAEIEMKQIYHIDIGEYFNKS